MSRASAIRCSLALAVLALAASISASAGAEAAPARSEEEVSAYGRPSWSFDGRKLAYSRSLGGRRGSGVVVANADGTEAKDVFYDDSLFSMAWSPVRNELAVNDNFRIFLVSGDGKRRRLLGGGDEPAWSPDGTRIAVDGSGVGGAISILHRGGRGRRLLTRADYHDSPAWSPDGRRIAFVFRRSKDDGARIGVIRANGARAASSGLRVLTTGMSPAWSPDGRAIAFVGGANRPRLSLQLVNADGPPRVRTLASLGVWFARGDGPSWSPDGLRLLFAREEERPAGTYGRRVGIYVVRATGRGLRRLTSGAAPVWSPDGKKIAFSDDRSCGGRSMIYVMNADGTERRQVTPCAAASG